MSKISDWLVLKNRWADLFQLWVVDSAQLEHAWSVIVAELQRFQILELPSI